MRAVVTRVREASVEIDGEIAGAINVGLLVLLGVGRDDDETDARTLAERIFGLRIFRDAEGAMNRGLAEVGGAILAISQFTLLGDARRGRRPSFVAAAPGELAEPLYDSFVLALRRLGASVATGRFGATMLVRSTNDGPVTILLDTKRTF